MCLNHDCLTYASTMPVRLLLRDVNYSGWRQLWCRVTGQVHQRPLTRHVRIDRTTVFM